jgi:hypothetical protein
MKTLILISAVAALTSLTLVESKAQGVEIGVPGVGVRIGEPGYRHRSYDERPGYREREVRYSRPSCKTVTIERPDGSVKRIRRCND